MFSECNIFVYQDGNAAAGRANKMKGEGYDVVITGPVEYVAYRRGAERIEGEDGGEAVEWYVVVASPAPIQVV